MRVNTVLRRALSAFVILSSVGFSALGPAAEPAGEFPANWKELPPVELVDVVYQFFNTSTERIEGVDNPEEILAHMATLGSQIKYSTSPLNYRTLNALHWAASGSLTDADQGRIRNELLARQDEWAGKPFSEVKDKIVLMQRAGLSWGSRLAEARLWRQAGGKLEDLAPADRVMGAQLIFSDSAPKRVYGSFKVRWTGFIVAPQTGASTFSLGPINASSGYPDRPVEINGKLSVGGQEILAPTSKNWVRESASVNLTANEPVPVTLEMDYLAPESASCAFHAQLSWSGPGISAAEIVPYNALRLPDGDLGGLEGTYSWVDDQGQPQSLTRNDYMVDFAWADPQLWLSPETVQEREIVRALWEDLSSDSFLASLPQESGEVLVHPYLAEPESAAANLFTSRKKSFLNKVLARPSLLDPVSLVDATALQGAFRFGAPDEALQVLGIWAQRHPDSECVLPGEERFEARSRSCYWRTSVRIAHDHPEQLEQLQAEYLKLPDGRCSLPVAYILGYAYQELGRIEEWIALLAQERESGSLSGDQKVNWLLAQAFAEEIRQGVPGFDAPTIPRVTDGMVWIDEARIVAESPESHRRLIKEWAGRLMATEQFAAAQSVLEGNAGLISAGDQAFLTEWTALNDTLRQRASGAAARQEAVAKQAYIDQLKARLAQASASGDTASASRYQSLISAAEQGQ